MAKSIYQSSRATLHPRSLATVSGAGRAHNFHLLTSELEGDARRRAPSIARALDGTWRDRDPGAEGAGWRISNDSTEAPLEGRQHIHYRVQRRYGVRQRASMI